MGREKEAIVAQGITRHALRKSTPSANSPSEEEGPRGSPDLWLALGAIVYFWSDRRNPESDRGWWRAAGRDSMSLGGAVLPEARTGVVPG